MMSRAPANRRNLRQFARSLLRLASSAAGAALGLGLVLQFIDPPSAPLFLASFGGSAVFLFGLTRAPAAQPRALFGGHLGGALIGIVCSALLGDALWVYVLALVLTLVFMLVTKTVHPPAGANPLIVIHAHATLIALWQPVTIGVAILALVAAFWSRLIPGMMHYPCQWLEKSPPYASWGGWLE
jgi:CBS-domain-containing membrane protein